jgi:YD repeat-containing protein
VFPGGISITRFFVTPTRMYMLQTTIRRDAPEVEVLATRALDTFRLLDAAALKAVKIEEATPAPLPQEPMAKKAKSDTQDENLKGKVREIIEDTVYLPGTRRERSNEKYYDARGNLIKEITFEEGYPAHVEVWGYIDGNRVRNSESIWFDSDQRPPSKEIIQSLMESPAGPPEGKKIDPRFSSRYAYKYDELGRLSEVSSFDNGGEQIDRTTYNYTTGRREERNFWGDAEEYNHKAYLLDAAGNVIEETSFNEKGAVDSRRVYKYEFDAMGNWIVQRGFAKKTVRGKTTLKPVWTIYRTITYYP